jgi:fluoride ion exporter CrcB/FEX
MIRIMYIAVGDTTTEAVLRYWASGIAYSILETTFPYGT